MPRRAWREAGADRANRAIELLVGLAMSNVDLRRKLEKLSPAIIACMIDQGTAHDDGGILEFSYDGYCHPTRSIRDATRAVERRGAGLV
jgi:hypothetical protein